MLGASMHAKPPFRPTPIRARHAAWARLWLACLAAVLSCTADWLSASNRRRLPILGLPRVVLARFVARLIFLCAIARIPPPRLPPHGHRRGKPVAGTINAALRAGAQRHLVGADGRYDLGKIGRTCANPEAAIADMIAVIKSGLRRRRAKAPCGASDVLRPRLHAVFAPAPDTS